MARVLEELGLKIAEEAMVHPTCKSSLFQIFDTQIDTQETGNSNNRETTLNLFYYQESVGTRGLVWMGHRPPKPRVGGSNPSGSAIPCYPELR